MARHEWWQINQGENTNSVEGILFYITRYTKASWVMRYLNIGRRRWRSQPFDSLWKRCVSVMTISHTNVLRVGWSMLGAEGPCWERSVWDKGRSDTDGIRDAWGAWGEHRLYSEWDRKPWRGESVFKATTWFLQSRKPAGVEATDMSKDYYMYWCFRWNILKNLMKIRPHHILLLHVYFQKHVFNLTPKGAFLGRKPAFDYTESIDEVVEAPWKSSFTASQAKMWTGLAAQHLSSLPSLPFSTDPWLSHARRTLRGQHS